MSLFIVICQLVIALGIFNVWLLRSGKATAWRGGEARTMKEEFEVYGLPAWFMKADWMVSIRHHSTSVLPPGGGLVQHEAKMFTVKISGPERAMLECLHLAPKVFDFLDCYEVMEGLANLRPDLVTEMLQSCRSIKAKRLFLYLAEKAQHRWLDYVDRSAVDLGKGDRSVAAPGGVYVSRYKLVVPEALADR